ncbi:CPP1-like family protein [Vulcanococcus limneticus]|uniref:CPP1-like family protein n=1 Tax=Vulcanococcus limneticus TaxID=2170428 RepID=UPI000B9867E4|nr:CPP1-like family protein [Vulcanococcus limneticus]MCP9791444.1 CPP1-like family protein [Vulcanococcus limneticus MW73D5]MCP9893399.1 CPP1-like family protein [Vulcanococcus limneticus Candia 3F8]MCP9896767.1 CPP1-like family protein [Vulcanococcus limneticus Candia 3B3]
MNQGAGSDPSADRSGDAGGTQPSPYERLGISPEASFDAVQEAKQARLAELGDDPQAKARIEAAYDAVLMDRLKERQQGKVSSAARSASQREATRPALATPPTRPALPVLPSLPALGRPAFQAPNLSLPRFALAEGRERWFPLASHGALLALLLFAPAASAELVLALATGVTVVNLQRRNGRLLPAVGWSVLLLSLGLLAGGLALQLLDPALPLGLPLAPPQVQSLPAILLLLLGALLIA